MADNSARSEIVIHFSKYFSLLQLIYQSFYYESLSYLVLSADMLHGFELPMLIHDHRFGLLRFQVDILHKQRDLVIPV